MNVVVKIFLTLCVGIYRFIKYVWFGLLFPIIFIVLTINNSINKKNNKKSPTVNLKEKKKIDLSSYKNEDLKIKKKGLSTLFVAIASIPSNIKKKIENIGAVKHAKNKKDIDTQLLLAEFSKDTEVNEGKKIIWEYVAYNEKGKKIVGYFEAYSRLDVHSFLIGEGLTVYSIKTSKLIQLLHSSIGGNRVKIKIKDLIFLLTQLSTYLKSGIPLVESLNILIKQTQKKAYKKILTEVTYDLTTGESFSIALEKRGVAFPKLLINMVRAAELTGELPEALDDMVVYYTEAEEVRKEMVSALTYPSIVFIFTLAVLTFVMVYVVPKFVDIYKTMDAQQIPSFTLLIIGVSEFLKKNILFILLVLIAVIIVINLLYKYVKPFRTMAQWLLMHFPVIKDIIIYNEVTLFSKTFSSLLTHNVYITDSMDILTKVTNNEIYKMMIYDTVANLAKGEKISKAFKDQWAFPIAAYEMIVTGEKTGQLAEMMGKVSTYYQGLHKGIVAKVKALLEPILIVFLTLVVGVILISVIIPMFSMYQQVQSLG